MRRSAILLTMLLAMLWQSVGLARAGSTIDALVDLQHAVLHWDDESHHHHDDGSYHVGDSDESTRHMMSDHVSASALMVNADLPVVRMGVAAPAACDASTHPHPVLDGPLRPPRLTA